MKKQLCFLFFVISIATGSHGMQDAAHEDTYYPCGPCRNCVKLYEQCRKGTLRSDHLQASGCFQVNNLHWKKSFMHDIPLMECLTGYVKSLQNDTYQNSFITLLEHGANPNYRPAIQYALEHVPWAIKLLIAYGLIIPKDIFEDLIHETFYFNKKLLINITPFPKPTTISSVLWQGSDKMKAYRRELRDTQTMFVLLYNTQEKNKSSDITSPLITMPPEVALHVISFWNQSLVKSWNKTWTKNYRAQLKKEALEWYATQPQS